MVHDDDRHGTVTVEDGVRGEGFIAVPRAMLGKLSPNALALHIALLSYGWQDGQCFPGMARLSQATRLGEKPLRAAKRELVDAGLLTEKRRGLGRPNLYTVRLWAERGESRNAEREDQVPPGRQHEVEAVEVGVSLGVGLEAKNGQDPTSLQANGVGSATRVRARPVTYNKKPVPERVVHDAEALLMEWSLASGRRMAAWHDSGGGITPNMRQVIGALLERPDVSRADWRRAVVNTWRNPPGWADGRPLQIGDVFGARAAGHALANTGEKARKPGEIRSGDFLALLDENGGIKP